VSLIRQALRVSALGKINKSIVGSLDVGNLIRSKLGLIGQTDFV
jgi:hypothetical protein